MVTRVGHELPELDSAPRSSDLGLTCVSARRRDSHGSGHKGSFGERQGKCKDDSEKVGCEDSYCGDDTADDTKCACRK
jgi:hypothetical protein